MNEKAADIVTLNTGANYGAWECLSQVLKFESEKYKAGYSLQICFKITQRVPKCC